MTNKSQIQKETDRLNPTVAANLAAMGKAIAESPEDEARIHYTNRICDEPANVKMSLKTNKSDK